MEHTTIHVNANRYKVEYVKELHTSFLTVLDDPLRGKQFEIDGKIASNHHHLIITIFQVPFWIFWTKPWITASSEGCDTCILTEKTVADAVMDYRVKQILRERGDQPASPGNFPAYPG